MGSEMLPEIRKHRIEKNKDFKSVAKVAKKEGHASIIVKHDEIDNRFSILAKGKVKISSLSDLLKLSINIISWSFQSLRGKKNLQNPLIEFYPLWFLSPYSKSKLDKRIRIDECMWVSEENLFDLVVDQKIIEFDEGNTWSNKKIGRIVSHWMAAHDIKIKVDVKE